MIAVYINVQNVDAVAHSKLQRDDGVALTYRTKQLGRILWEQPGTTLPLRLRYIEPSDKYSQHAHLLAFENGTERRVCTDG